MSRPYSKTGNMRRGGGGGRGAPPHNRGGGGGGFIYNNNDSRRGGRSAGGGPSNGRGVLGKANHNNNNRPNNNGNNNNNRNGGGAAPANDVMKALLTLLFEKNRGSIFSEANSMLNLSAMHESPDLATVATSVDLNSVGFCTSLVQVLREHFANSIRIINLNNNRIKKPNAILNALMECDMHAGITAISAMNNNIQDLAFVGVLKKFSSLTEVLLTGNPVCSTETYRTTMIRNLPQLRVLDQSAVERAALMLPNPVMRPPHEGIALIVLQFLESSIFQWMVSGVDARIDETAPTFYAPTAALSISANADYIPTRMPTDALHNSAHLSKDQLRAMQADMVGVRNGTYIRNLARSMDTAREVAIGLHNIKSKFRAFAGLQHNSNNNNNGVGRQIRIAQEPNSNANVCFLEHGVKHPICILTVHSKLHYTWTADSQMPFIAAFIDRTVVLTYDATTNQWRITNDLMFVRPDRVVADAESGSPSSALFFANQMSYVMRQHRILKAPISVEAMQLLYQLAVNDAKVREWISVLCAMPPEEIQRVSASPDALKQALGIAA